MTSTKGGKREGAGRKALAPSERMVRRTVTLPTEVVAVLSAMGNGNLSKGIRLLVLSK